MACYFSFDSPSLRAIWLSRNRCVFYSSNFDISVLVRNVLNLALEWTLAIDFEHENHGKRIEFVDGLL